MGAWLLAFGIPIAATVCNLILLIFDRKCRRQFRNFTDIVIFGVGVPLTTVLAYMMNFKEWNVPIDYVDSFYTPIAFESLPTFLTLCGVALIGYGVVRVFGVTIPPLAATLCFAGIYVGMALSVVVCVQLCTQPSTSLVTILSPFLTVLPINYCLCSVRVIRDTVRDMSAMAAAADYSNPFLKLCTRILSKTGTFLLVPLVLAVPLLGVVIVTLLLFGQQPDAIIRAFTQTAEWTLSQQIPPPALTYEGHYLCTVAARGDEKLVKPLRAGRRHGRPIVVNRQLLVANAFEDLIAERTPHFHRLVRHVYDTCGRPISRHINTPRRSNVTYLLMKPLEWVFVIVLYLFDRHPENRIARQYTK